MLLHGSAPCGGGHIVVPESRTPVLSLPHFWLPPSCHVNVPAHTPVEKSRRNRASLAEEKRKDARYANDNYALAVWERKTFIAGAGPPSAALLQPWLLCQLPAGDTVQDSASRAQRQLARIPSSANPSSLSHTISPPICRSVWSDPVQILGVDRIILLLRPCTLALLLHHPPLLMAAPGIMGLGLWARVPADTSYKDGCLSFTFLFIAESQFSPGSISDFSAAPKIYSLPSASHPSTLPGPPCQMIFLIRTSS